MKLNFHIPTYPLRNFISSIMNYEGYTGASKFEMLLPDGSPRLIIALSEEPRFRIIQSGKSIRLPDSWITGLYTKPIIYQSEQNASTISIQFEAYGLTPLLGISAMDITNHIIETELILKNDISELREKLVLCKNFIDRIDKIEHFFLERLCHDGFMPGIVEYMVNRNTFDNTSLKLLSEQYKYSQKHIISAFKRTVGTTPKQLQLVNRVNKAINLLSDHQNLSLAQVAYSCGFYDQAHFIKRFKEVTSLTPSAYLKNNKAYPHVMNLY